MVIIKEGSLLEAEEDILIHQVNVDGLMGAGIAKQFAEQYQGLENYYSEYCKRRNYDYKKQTFFGNWSVFYISIKNTTY